ncbi:MAG TPA: DUF4348 domain-containing protein [Bacteroidales bacterium]|nr:DUF4348 domain-containing protein [Bacteroidales bacterium]
MKKTFFVFSCILFFMLFSCNQSKEKKESVLDNNKDYVTVIDSSLVGHPDEFSEDFNTFVEKFSKEERFQIQRIKFPISIIVPDSEHEGMASIEETISRYDWEQLDLTYDSTYLTRPFDQYYQVVRFNNDTAIVEIRGINNGIYADYYFALIDKKWYLVTLYEASF